MLLTPEEVEARLKLYTDLRDALNELNALQNSVPEVCPSDLEVISEKRLLSDDAERRATFVVRRAWPALRKAMLADAQKKVDDAEAAVKAFEAGEEVKTDGV